MNPFDIKGKCILITGASSGIGASCAVEISKLGGKCIITARNQERINRVYSELNGDGHSLEICDLTNNADVTELISRLPKLDGVVLCAGVNQILPIAYLTRKKVDSIFNVNFFSQIELLRLLIKKHLLKEGSAVVAISSIGGISSFTFGAAAYGASKAALLSWMKTAAREMAPKVRVNCICAGPVRTPMNDSGEISEEQYQKYIDSIPMKRFAEPEEIAYSVIYLLSDSARWITGSALIIDGGSTLI